MNIDFKAIGKAALPVASMALAVASAIVGNMNQKAQTEDTVAKKVAEALSEQAKES